MAARIPGNFNSVLTAGYFIMRNRSILLTVAVCSVAAAGCAITPEPLSLSEVATREDSGFSQISTDQEAVSGPIDLYEAMARALKYNLDHRVEEMTAAVRTSELNLAHFSLLPNVVAGSGYAGRDNYNASNSVNVLTGVESLATSTSQEKRFNTADVAFSWNVLDFGLSYVRARQAGDKYLIAEEMRRKVMNRTMEDVRTAYWRAVSADRLISKLQRLEARIKTAQSNTRATAADRQTSPITAVTYERELVEIKRTILEIQRDLSVARTQLATLMNLKPGTHFVLAGDRSGSTLTFSMPVDEMITTALHNRPELMEVWYQQRINSSELTAAMLELLPGFTAYAGSNFDSNDFLYNNNWISWGAKASWNVIRVFQFPAKRAVIEAQDDMLDARVRAVAMAVMTQAHVSRIRYLHARKELRAADEYLDVQTRLVKLMRIEASGDRISEQTLIREEMNTLVAEARRDIAHASLQNAYAGIYTSMGLDPYRKDVDPAQDVKSLASRLRSVWVERGDVARGTRA